MTMAGSPPPPAPEAMALLADGSVDEVIVAAPDLQGRLLGTALSPEYFRERLLGGDGVGACTYLYAVDVEMETGPGYAYDPWQGGFGDLRLIPDPATLRRAPWRPRSAIVIADALWPDGSTVEVAPRTVLRRQLDRLAGLGLCALAGTEPEFLVFEENYRDAARRDYTRLTPASTYNIDYALAGTERLDDLVRSIRTAMAVAGARVESARAEVHPGQYEIVFGYDEAMRTCDQHVLYKTTAKKIAGAAGRALTFMAKYDQGEGNSCHVHLSLRTTQGGLVLAAATSESGSDNSGERGGSGSGSGGMSELMRWFVAGQLACLAELTLLYAPTVNSYKRLAPGAFAPTGISWGYDNRTCAVRVVGSGGSLRIEHRVPGGDANPYLAVAGMIAAGLYGIEHRLPLEPPRVGNAFAANDVPRLPTSLREAARAWRESAVARAAFGQPVVDHLAHAAQVELAGYERTVTDWERRRCFERF
ncbi:Glutamate--ammonia ligase [Parafrankia sp. EUN1f]|nr:Glutamate--ammonia ligase [Parafrankia sp. EUN1f]